MESIKKLIQEGKTERVLTLILGNTSDASVTKEATLLMSRLKRWQLETRGGVISHADAQLEANKINAALLDLVNGLDPQIYNFPVNLADSADEKLDETAFPTDNVQPLNASKYVWISVVALLLSIILFVGLVYYQPSLTKTLGDRAFYLTLFPLAFSTAAFLFGVMRSYAIQKGQVFSQSVSLGGPIVAALMVIVGGFMLPQNETTFTITAFLHGEKGTFDVLIENKGTLDLDLGAERKSANIANKGEANFKNIPPQYQGAKIRVGLSNLPDFELVHPDSVYVLKASTLYVPIRYKSKNREIGGNVTDESGNQLLSGVRVSVGNQVVYTDANGIYSLKIPLEQKEDDYLLSFRKDGYQMLQQRCAATLTCDCRLKNQKKH